MSSFKDLRIVDNFYQTSSYIPMPTVLISSLAEDGSTSVGSYSLCFPYYIAGKGYYALIVTSDWQVVLADLCPPSDGWGGYESETFAHPVHPVLACRIYRGAGRECLTWLHSRKPPQFWFSTDGEASRRALYLRYALMLEEHGYTCYASSEDTFCFVRRAG